MAQGYPWDSQIAVKKNLIVWEAMKVFTLCEWNCGVGEIETAQCLPHKCFDGAGTHEGPV